MDRFRSVQERIKSNEQAAQERYRSNLLRAISHDLRTPLSGIMGTSEMLMNMTPKATPATLSPPAFIRTATGFTPLWKTS
jgi:K+-sensing histidine kinase KdpD